MFLAEKHSLQVQAGAMLPSWLPQPSPSGFVSVGDPIYNVADPRWNSGSRWNLASRWVSSGLGLDPGGQLNRLPGTRREVEASAAAWQETSSGSSTPVLAPVVVLEGAAASRTHFLQAISSAPRVIHLATHALTAPSGEEASLAFGLGRDGRPEMLSTSEIRTLRVAGSVVVMTGCATAPSDVRPGLGLAGLVRAWTVAGASAVVATEWAVQDSGGSSLLASFYRHLSAAPAGAAVQAFAVAEALRSAQIEMIHSGGSRTAWAAYQVFTGHPGSRSEAP